MKDRLPKALLVCFSLFTGSVYSNSEQTVICPVKISTKQELQGLETGWEASTRPLNNVLSDVVFFDGHPSNNMSLKYDKTSKIADDEVLIWGLDPTSEYWLRCGYFGTTVALIKRLPIATKKCEVTYSKSGVILTMSCD